MNKLLSTLLLLLSLIILTNSSCTSTSCLNGGTCVSGNCKCENQWTGETCQTKKIQIYQIFGSYEYGGEAVFYGQFTANAPTSIIIGGNKQCIPTLVKSDEIRCTSPPGTGTVSLSVTQLGYTWYADGAYWFVIPPQN